MEKDEGDSLVVVFFFHFNLRGRKMSNLFYKCPTGQRSYY